jgi:hypothetical protein
MVIEFTSSSACSAFELALDTLLYLASSILSRLESATRASDPSFNYDCDHLQDLPWLELA